MTKAVWTKVATAAAVVVLFSAFVATNAAAQNTATGSVSVSVTVAGRAAMTIDPAVTFADANPDTVPTLTSAGLNLQVRARTAATSNVTLTVLASGDLSAGAGVNIAIGTLTWSTASAGFVNGAGNSTTAQNVGSWTGPGARNGTLVFSLPNSWAYATGTYTTTLNYTLTVP